MGSDVGLHVGRTIGNILVYVTKGNRKAKLLLDLETDSDIKVSVTYEEYYKRLEQRLKYLQKVLLDFKMRHLALLNKDRESCRSLVFSGTVHWFEGRQAFIHYCGLHQV